MGVGLKLTTAVAALVLLAGVTIMVTTDVVSVLEEDTFEAFEAIKLDAPASAGHPKLVGQTEDQDQDDDSLFDALTSPEPTSPPPPQNPGIVLQELTLLGVGAVGKNKEGQSCLKYGPEVCETKPQACAKKGPSCTYKKICVAKSKVCVKDKKSVCAQSGKRCHYTFSKPCIKCAQKTPLCWHAHNIAATCISTCEKNCFKDATCERKCAEGCLKRYEGYIRMCKKDCKPCAVGTKQKCWNACYEWKACSNPTKSCKKVDSCVKKGKECTFKKVCTKWGKDCRLVKTCSKHINTCTNKTTCVRRATKCSHKRTKACKACRGKVSACGGYDRVKSRCFDECDKVKCAKMKGTAKVKCTQKCYGSCRKTMGTLNKICTSKCPACKHRSPSCTLKCLEKKVTRSCQKSCKSYVMKKKCSKACKLEEVRKHCVGKCAKWKSTQVCKDSCTKWNFTRKQPCKHNCVSHGMKHVCDKKKTKCVQWKGGKVCKPGPCVKWGKPYVPNVSSKTKKILAKSINEVKKSLGVKVPKGSKTTVKPSSKSSAPAAKGSDTKPTHAVMGSKTASTTKITKTLAADQQSDPALGKSKAKVTPKVVATDAAVTKAKNVAVAKPKSVPEAATKKPKAPKVKSSVPKSSKVKSSKVKSSKPLGKRAKMKAQIAELQGQITKLQPKAFPAEATETLVATEEKKSVAKAAPQQTLATQSTTAPAATVLATNVAAQSLISSEEGGAGVNPSHEILAKSWTQVGSPAVTITPGKHLSSDALLERPGDKPKSKKQAAEALANSWLKDSAKSHTWLKIPTQPKKPAQPVLAETAAPKLSADAQAASFEKTITTSTTAPIGMKNAFVKPLTPQQPTAATLEKMEKVITTSPTAPTPDALVKPALQLRPASKKPVQPVLSETAVPKQSPAAEAASFVKTITTSTMAPVGMKDAFVKPVSPQQPTVASQAVPQVVAITSSVRAAAAKSAEKQVVSSQEEAVETAAQGILASTSPDRLTALHSGKIVAQKLAEKAVTEKILAEKMAQSGDPAAKSKAVMASTRAAAALARAQFAEEKYMEAKIEHDEIVTAQQQTGTSAPIATTAPAVGK